MANEHPNKGFGLSLLEVWLEHHPKPDEKRFLYGDKIYSAKEIVKEARLGSEVGNEHMNMVIKFYELNCCASSDEFIRKYFR